MWTLYSFSYCTFWHSFRVQPLLLDWHVKFYFIIIFFFYTVSTEQISQRYHFFLFRLSSQRYCFLIIPLESTSSDTMFEFFLTLLLLVVLPGLLLWVFKPNTHIYLKGWFDTQHLYVVCLPFSSSMWVHYFSCYILKLIRICKKVANTDCLNWFRLLMDVNGGSTDKRWQRETLVHEPTIVALWPLDVQFVNK